MKTFAYFDTGHEFPEEIVMAAGFAPMKILGHVQDGTAAADAYLLPYLCPSARGCLTYALTHSAPWAGIGFAHGCDATNRQFDVWKAHLDHVPFFWVNTPMKIDKTAQDFYRRELRRFIENLNAHYAMAIGTEDLKDAIRQSNGIKALMRQLAALRATKDILNREYFELTRKAVQMPKDDLMESLRATLADWENRRPFPADKTPVLLTGSDVTFPQWVELLDVAGLRVIRDDLSLGERYFAASILETGDPLEALAAYSCSIPQPPTRMPSDARLDYLQKALQESNINVVVSQNMKFCEPYALDAVWSTAAIRSGGYDVIHLERDYTTADDYQMLTRLEAFREIVRQKEADRHA